LTGRGRLEDMSFADDLDRDGSLNYGLFAIQPLTQLQPREYFILFDIIVIVIIITIIIRVIQVFLRNF
jgi:hypothetical protein